MPVNHAPHITTLKRPLTRRIGRLVVTIDEQGLRFRGKHKKSWRKVTWRQVAALSEPGTIMAQGETMAGERELERIGASEHDEPAREVAGAQEGSAAEVVPAGL